MIISFHLLNEPDMRIYVGRSENPEFSTMGLGDIFDIKVDKILIRHDITPNDKAYNVNANLFVTCT